LAQLKTVHTAPWPQCQNKNVFSNRPYSLRLGGRLLQTCGHATAKVVSPKLLHVRLTSNAILHNTTDWSTNAENIYKRFRLAASMRDKPDPWPIWRSCLKTTTNSCDIFHYYH